MSFFFQEAVDWSVAATHLNGHAVQQPLKPSCAIRLPRISIRRSDGQASHCVLFWRNPLPPSKVRAHPKLVIMTPRAKHIHIRL